MKKIFLILAAAVMLSSVAFAKPYGEKSRPDRVGDIVFADGTATAWREGLVFTEEQKEAVMAVIFYVGTKCSNNGERRVLGVGVAQLHSFAWCTESANAYSKSITKIQCKIAGKAGALKFTGDLDGSDNLEQIGAYLRENGIADDTADESRYPAFYYAKNYAKGSQVSGTEFESGWYLPSIAELFQVWKSRRTVNDVLEECYGAKFNFSKYYWSSSQCVSDDNFVYCLTFSDGDWGFSRKSQREQSCFACCIRAFN